MEGVTAEEVEGATFPTSGWGYDTVQVDSFLKQVASALRSHEQTYLKLGSEVGDVLLKTKDAASRFIAEAEAEAAEIREAASAEALRIREQAEAQTAKMRQEAERDTQKTRRAAKREAAKRIKEAEAHARHLEQLESEARERISSLQQVVASLGHTIESVEPTHPEEAKGDQLETSEAKAAVAPAESPEAGEPDVNSLAPALPSHAHRTDAGMPGGGEPRAPVDHPAGGLEAPRTSAREKRDRPARRSTSRTTLVFPAPAGTAGQGGMSPVVDQGSDPERLSGPSEIRENPRQGAEGPMGNHVVWTALAALSAFLGILGLLLGLFLTLFGQGGVRGPLLAIASIALVGAAGWAIKTGLAPGLPEGFVWRTRDG